MPVEVKVNLDQYPAGEPVAINGMGVVENGGTFTFDDEQELAFVSYHGMTPAEAFKDQAGIEVSGTGKVKVEDLPETNMGAVTDRIHRTVDEAPVVEDSPVVVEKTPVDEGSDK